MWESQQTCTEVRLAASAQDGVELRLVRSHLVFASRIKFLLPKQTRRISKWDASSPPSDCYCYNITSNVPGRPVGPGRCPHSPFHPDFPEHRTLI